MSADSYRARAEDLRRWCAQFPDSTLIADAVPRQRATVVGVVYRIRLVPGTSLEVTLEDGSGRLTAVWSGRSSLPGVELGGAASLTGTVAASSDGTLLMRNPSWELIAEPSG